MFVEKNRDKFVSVHEFAVLFHERADTMGKYLNGEQQPSLKKIEQWASLLGIPVETLFEANPKAEWPLKNKKYRSYKDEEEPTVTVLCANAAEEEKTYCHGSDSSCEDLEADIYCLGIVLRQILTEEQMKNASIQWFFQKYEL